MSERISEAMLADIEKTASPPYEAPTPGSWRHTSVRLGAEVRRLRALIERVATPKEGDGSIDQDGRDYEQGICQWCGLALEEGRSYERSHLADCAWSALRTEADSMREEQVKEESKPAPKSRSKS